MASINLTVLILSVLISACFTTTSATVWKVLGKGPLPEMKATIAITQKSGLSVNDSQHVLDMHNVLRLVLASGKQKSAGGMMPTAADMQAVDWDDDLAAYAQNYADQCREGHSKLENFKPQSENYKKASMAENLSGDVTALERDMFGEVRWWHYETFACDPGQQCGHYIPFAGWGMNRVGCGWKYCEQQNPPKMLMVCIYAGYISTAKFEGQPRKAYQHEYLKGPPCSACQPGWDFCMGGGLCATKEQCESDPSNKCDCLHKKETCKSNGGIFDKPACTCKCPADKWGINCAKACKDEVDDICGMTCPEEEVANAYFCPKSCGSCGTTSSAAYRYWKNRPAKNSNKLKVRHTFEDPDKKAENVDWTKKPMYGKCKNQADDTECEKLFLRRYCDDLFYGPTVRRYCGLSCGKCPGANSEEKKEKKSKGDQGDQGNQQSQGDQGNQQSQGDQGNQESQGDGQYSDSNGGDSGQSSDSSNGAGGNQGGIDPGIKELANGLGIDISGYQLQRRRRRRR